MSIFLEKTSLDEVLERLSRQRIQKERRWEEKGTLQSNKSRQEDENNFNAALYVRTKNTNLLHYKDCEYLKRISKWDWVVESRIDTKRPMCQACKIKLLISYGATDAEKKMDDYIKLFGDNRIGSKSLFAFYVVKRAKTTLQGNNLFVDVGADHWKIELFGDEITLYHNNYSKGKGSVRYERAGYHAHDTAFDSLWPAMKYIMN